MSEEIIRLWPDGPPRAIEGVGPEVQYEGRPGIAVGTAMLRNISDPTLTVPADAPPLFTTIAQDDRLLFKVVEGLYADWSNADRPAALHIFSRGGHGFGMIAQGLAVDRWVDLLEAWLTDLKL